MAAKQYKRLYRSKTNKIIAGLLGGIAEYMDVDPVIVRLAFIALTIASGVVPGIVFYLVALLVVPSK
jgi:phage shock protein C